MATGGCDTSKRSTTAAQISKNNRHADSGDGNSEALCSTRLAHATACFGGSSPPLVCPSRLPRSSFARAPSLALRGSGRLLFGQRGRVADQPQDRHTERHKNRRF
jgi:hypothetical protein